LTQIGYLFIPLVPLGNLAFPRAMWPFRTCKKFSKWGNLKKSGWHQNMIVWS